MVEAADEDGSTEYIIRRCEELPAGASAVIGTDWNLVNRLRLRHPDKRISCLKEDLCPCVTMNRIDLPKLTWCLESLAAGEIVNVVARGRGDAPLGPARARPDARPGVTAAEVVAAALAEDLGGARRHHLGSCSSRPTPRDRRAGGRARPRACWPAARRPRRCCGRPASRGEWLATTARAWRPGTVVAEISGPARAVLTAERTLLNLLCHLSGVATLTAAYVEAARPGGGARHAQDDARDARAREGRRRGGRRPNHRMGLYDRVLVKDNHLALAGAELVDAVARARRELPGRAGGGGGRRPRRACGAASTPAPTGSCSTT